VLILNQYIILILPGLNSIKCLSDCKTLFLQEEDYVGEIKGGLRPTMRLIVMGIVHKQPKRLVYQTHLSVCLSVCHSLSLSLCVCVCVCVSCVYLLTVTSRIPNDSVHWERDAPSVRLHNEPVVSGIQPEENMGANRE